MGSTGRLARLIAMISMLAALVSAPLLSQTPQMRPEPPRQEKQEPKILDHQPPAVSDQDVEAFAAASKDIEKLNIAFLPKFEEANKQGPAAAEVTRRQALDDMKRAVEKRGLSVDKFNAIYDLAGSNPDLQRRIDKALGSDR